LYPIGRCEVLEHCLVFAMILVTCEIQTIPSAFSSPWLTRSVALVGRPLNASTAGGRFWGRLQQRTDLQVGTEWRSLHCPTPSPKASFPALWVVAFVCFETQKSASSEQAHAVVCLFILVPISAARFVESNRAVCKTALSSWSHPVPVRPYLHSRFPRRSRMANVEMTAHRDTWCEPHREYVAWGERNLAGSLARPAF
jgi:hypothetical protein